ncbi:MAG: HAD-IC family P-type ATPase [Chloroflexi bacterium]|nr:HAD-IC family P-type ATPase [Chloroflexota bacterium]
MLSTDTHQQIIPQSGLTEVEATRRRQQGQGNTIALKTSRTYSQIVRGNVINAINIILFGLGAVMVAIGRVGDAATSVGLVGMNMVIGIFQEVRAKRQLDRIALLTRPRVTVIRDGQAREIDPNQVVLGDLIKVNPGDQIVVDGVVVGESNAEMDESLLTGEADLIQKAAGDEILSGSFCVSGGAHYTVTRVGNDSFANKLTASAREFQQVQTPLQKEINLILRFLMALAVFLGIQLLFATILSETPFMRQVQFASVIIGLVPNGLFFMVILAYAMGAVRIVRQGALVQQSNAVESLSRVTVLCTDKTGTLTANRIVYEAVHPFEKGRADIERLLADVVRSQSATNKTSEALLASLAGEKRPLLDEVPFSSRLKWSAVAFDQPALKGVYVIGALEMLRVHIKTLPDGADETLTVLADEGKRVLTFAFNPEPSRLHDEVGGVVLPDLSLLGFVTFTDELRPHLQQTLNAFRENGITVKVISGDNPQTVAALAKQAGFPGDLTYVSGPDLATMSPAEFEHAAVESTVFGRITPEQKEALVDALKAQGHYVAMMGDGVNDVLSLKKADIGIAMQSGSSATRNVADMILMGDSFEALPPAFTEGQRIINGMKDILRLFLTRVAYTALLIIGVSLLNLGFPLVPKHNALLSLFVVGIPTLVLALWARPGALPKGSLLREITHFVIPAALVTYIFGMVIYVGAAFMTVVMESQVDVTPEMIDSFERYAGIDYDIATSDEFLGEVAVLAAQTALTSFLVYSGLLLVVFVEPPIKWFVGGDEFSGDWRPTLIAGGLGIGFFAILLIEPLRTFAELLALPWWGHLLILVVTAIWMLVLRTAWRKDWLGYFTGSKTLHPRPAKIR